MKSVLNPYLFRHRESSTAGFNNLCTLMHPLRQPGHYQGVVVSDGRMLGTFEIRCEAGAAATQVDVDVSNLDPLVSRKERYCGTESAVLTVAPNGYVVLYSTGHHAKLQVTLSRHGEKGREADFDSRRLQPGDLAAFRVWHPGRYRIVDTQGRSELSLEVRDAKGERYPALHKLEAQMLVLSPKGFESQQAEIWPTQPVVIKVEAPCALELQSQEVREKAGAKSSG